jgi:hypothetical protein
VEAARKYFEVSSVFNSQYTNLPVNTFHSWILILL